MEHGDAAGGEVGIDGGLVGQHFLAGGGVDDSHDLGIAEFLTTAAPVTVGHADVAAAFGAGAFLHAGGHGPVEESGGTGAGAAVAFLALVIQEGGKAANDLAGIE